MSCWYPSFIAVIHVLGMFYYWHGWWEAIPQVAFCF